MTEMGDGGGVFLSTRWSLVLTARDRERDAEASREALGELIGQYWRPVYFFIRRKGEAAEQAKDLCQGFFAHLLEGSGLRGVDPGRGTFRSYLLGALGHYLSNSWRDSRRLKRGGGKAPLSLDFDDAERDYLDAPDPRDSPERSFRRRWAEEALAEAIERLRLTLLAEGRERYYEVLVRSMGARPMSYAAIADELEISTTDVSNSLRRARARLREQLIEVLLPGVRTQQQVDDEVRDLFEALQP